MANDTRLIPIQKIGESRPDWPFGYQWTTKLIKRGHLGCVRLGRRVFVTDADLEAFIANHRVANKAAP